MNEVKRRILMNGDVPPINYNLHSPSPDNLNSSSDLISSSLQPLLQTLQTSNFQQNLTFAVIVPTSQGPVVYYLPALSGLRVALTQQVLQTLEGNISYAGAEEVQPMAQTQSTTVGHFNTSGNETGSTEKYSMPNSTFQIQLPPSAGDASGQKQQNNT
jgi:hypothetical protein